MTSTLKLGTSGGPTQGPPGNWLDWHPVPRPSGSLRSYASWMPVVDRPLVPATPAAAKDPGTPAPGGAVLSITRPWLPFSPAPFTQAVRAPYCAFGWTVICAPAEALAAISTTASDTRTLPSTNRRTRNRSIFPPHDRPAGIYNPRERHPWGHGPEGQDGGDVIR